MWRWVSMSDLFNASGCAGSTKQEAVLFAYLGRLVVPLLLGSLVRGEHAVVQKAFFNHKGCTIIKITDDSGETLAWTCPCFKNAYGNIIY
jgi:hypothetical protein